jgi:hypothetical protein
VYFPIADESGWATGRLQGNTGWIGLDYRKNYSDSSFGELNWIVWERIFISLASPASE